MRLFRRARQLSGRKGAGCGPSLALVAGAKWYGPGPTPTLHFNFYGTDCLLQRQDQPFVLINY